MESVGVGVEDESFEEYIDTSVVRSARLIYETYYDVHPELTEPPLGVAINRLTLRGKLIFNGRPVLLPQECFVPFQRMRE
ncbi:MAG: hypothetical protein HC936_06045 [Leptolyngbyaceae cyanobacterium SU_3_3]|nr:hypothetical protein [Leptolyngbyaceae cyanobacterium SU_3_3]NJR48658.1 hypothetical protein [Leptolyngbyaceae cyanobacterium CSU_1_3]